MAFKTLYHHIGTQPFSSVEHLSFSDGHGDHPECKSVSGAQRTPDLATWEEVLGHCTTGT